MLINQLYQFMRFIDPAGRRVNRRDDSVGVIDHPVVFVPWPSFRGYRWTKWLLHEPLKTPARSAFVCEDPAPKTLGAPDARTQAFELDNLTVIYKDVYFRAVVFDIPREDFRIRCFKHRLLE